MSPIDALPEGFELGPDNRTWLMRLKKKFQIAILAGPRSHGFWKWREMPKQLYLVAGKGMRRYENADGSWTIGVEFTEPKDTLNPDFYLSRIQPWCRWHISLQWPLFFNCHIIYRSKNVVEWPAYQSAFGICKMLTFGIGFKRDSDRVYWLTTNLGGNFE